MKLDRGGLISGGIYVVIAVPLMLFAEFGTVDVKGAYIVNVLATLPVGWLLSVLGLVDWVISLPWLNNFIAFFLLNLAFFYLIGWGIRSLYRYDQRKIQEQLRSS